MNKNKMINEMIEWFFENYEDPANGVPYDGSEGGYQYVSGGPYYPKEELDQNFPEAPNICISKVCEAIYPKGYEWVKKGQY